MVIHDRGYHKWEGTPTPSWSRFLIIPKYAVREVFKSRVFNRLYIGCFLYPLACLGLIYLWYNLDVLKYLQMSDNVLPKIDALFYFSYINVQAVLCIVVTFIVGPPLISVDMVNNALPLYLCRPFSRFDYIIGKMMVLFLLLSAITWMPGLFLFLFSCSLSKEPIFWQNMRIPIALFLYSWLVILLLSASVLAISAYVKKKHVARWGFLGILFATFPLSEAVNGIFHTSYGSLLRVTRLVYFVSGRLFDVSVPALPAVPVYAVLAGLFLFCLFLLYRRIRPVEIVA